MLSQGLRAGQRLVRLRHEPDVDDLFEAGVTGSGGGGMDEQLAKRERERERGL